MSTILSEYADTGSCRIKNIKGPQSVRLLEMGLTPGTEIQIVRAAPLGFPIEIKVRGYLLTLRESEAQCLEIE